ncbi:MAG: protein kinase, partial [Dokdonella sp.]
MARALALFDELVDLDAPTRASRLDEVRTLDAVLADQVAGMLLADANTGCLMDQGMSDLAASISAGAKAASAGSEGRQIGPFVLRRLVGLGGMGEVWLAQRVDGDFNQEVALKLCRYGMGSEDILRRFVQERRILADLSHPGIARFIDGGVGDTGAPWFAMEYVEGVALTDYSRNHR